MINFSVATSWNDELLGRIAKLNDEFKNLETRVHEVFGAFQTSITGCGRPAPKIPKIDYLKAKNHIKVSHSNGLEFDYVINATCLGNREFDREYHIQLIDFLTQLVDMEVDTVTITVPYLIEIVKDQFPELKIKASVLCHIDSVQKAVFYEHLGVDCIGLDPDINRNFGLIKMIRKSVKCDIEILASRSCIYKCPYLLYHFNLAAHASQQTKDGGDYGSFYVEYCLTRCLLERLLNLQEIIKVPWVRPEDTKEYHDFGINYMKLTDRMADTDWLTRCFRAYLSKRYEGNLYDIINKHDIGSFVNNSPLSPTKNLPPLEIHIDNSLLSDFLDFFKNQKFPCNASCTDCNYCSRVAEKVITVDKKLLNEYVMNLRSMLSKLTSSSFINDQYYNEMKNNWKKEVDTRRPR